MKLTVKRSRTFQRRSGRSGILTMPTLTLKPDTYVSLKYHLGDEEDAIFFSVESDIPVKTYIVRPKGLEFFEAGKIFKYYGGFPDPRKHQSQNLWLPFTGSWYLIISNQDKRATAHLEYEVSF